MDEAGVRKVITENNRALLVEIKDLVNSSISDLKRSNESIASQQMSESNRLKRDSAPQFNKKSNEEQFKANKAIKDAVEDAQIALQSNDFEKTKQALDKDDQEDEKKIRAESKAVRFTKRFTSRSIRESNVPSTSTTAQLSASQLPNLFSRV